MTDYDDEVLADNPEAYWKAEEPSGTTAVDSSGNGHHGTYIGSVELGRTALVPSEVGTTTSCRIALDGSEYMSVAHSSGLSMTECTVEVWVKTKENVDYSEFPYVISKTYDPTNNLNYSMSGSVNSGSAAKKPTFGYYRGGAWYQVVAPDNTVHSTVYHVVGTYDGTDLKLYIDAVLVDSDTPAVTMLGDTDNLDIGKRWDGNSTEFTYQKLALYDYALSEARIEAHFEVGSVVELALASSLSGTGSMTSAMTETEVLAAGLTGTGTLSASMSQTDLLVAALTGVGSLSAEGRAVGETFKPSEWAKRRRFTKDGRLVRKGIHHGVR